MSGSAAIAEHGVIGDLRTAALVTRDGTIDFMCYPRFESPTMFAALLDADGGSFSVRPVDDDVDIHQSYQPDTNVLATRFATESGTLELIDFMAVDVDQAAGRVLPTGVLVRLLRGIEGHVRVRARFAPHFDYARGAHRLERGDGHWLVSEDEPGSLALRLYASEALERCGGALGGEWTVGAGEWSCLLLSPADSPCEPGDLVEHGRWRWEVTSRFWRQWASRCCYRGRWTEAVHRAVLSLKLMQSVEDGGFVAAPTFGLPESLGGVRNWDYRYTWSRDAALTIRALLLLGYDEEASAFAKWLGQRCRPEEQPNQGELQVLYRVGGQRLGGETELAHLAGYRGSRPVRIGNEATHQLQLDIYGTVIDALHLYEMYEPRIDVVLWREMVASVEWARACWDRPDHGIWEVRNEPQHFLSSKVMCWVALDRAIDIARKRSLPAPLVEWIACRDRMFETIYDDYWDEALGSFVSYPGAGAVDASLMFIPMVGMLRPNDPRWCATLAVIERDLVVEPLVKRYRQGDIDDGLPGEEGFFCACSFWLAEVLARVGRVDEARLVFDQMMAYRNHLGLLSEELGRRGEMLGNFPQGLTLLSLISAAHEIEYRVEARARARGGRG